jgi:hypothetical protein
MPGTRTPVYAGVHVFPVVVATVVVATVVVATVVLADDRRDLRGGRL